jgi:hypothetical protein
MSQLFDYHVTSVVDKARSVLEHIPGAWCRGFATLEGIENVIYVSWFEVLLLCQSR